MEATEMLDVLHYFLEEDLNNRDDAETSTKSATRVRIYEQFYGREYKYAYKGAESSENAQAGNYLDEDDYIDSEIAAIKPFNPKEQKTKPYAPPTQFDGLAAEPFGSILDAPMK